MIVPPQVEPNNWYILQNPRILDSKAQPMVNKTQRRIQRKYTAWKENAKIKENIEGQEKVLKIESMANPRFDRSSDSGELMESEESAIQTKVKELSRIMDVNKQMIIGNSQALGKVEDVESGNASK